MASTLSVAGCPGPSAAVRYCLPGIRTASEWRAKTPCCALAADKRWRLQGRAPRSLQLGRAACPISVHRPLPSQHLLRKAQPKQSVRCAVKDRERRSQSSEVEDPFVRIQERWDVPWGGKVTALTMISWLIGFIATGVSVSFTLAKLGFGRRQGLDLDTQAFYILINQLAQTAVGLSIVSAFVRPYRPLPDDFFRVDFSEPLSLRSGWLFNGALGVAAAFGAVQVAAWLTTIGGSPPPPREGADALLQLLPIIGASPASTASLLVVTGVCAPILEETVFRGFFLTSLTKWMPTPLAIVVSSAAFAGAHLTPGEFPQLAALGVVLGLSYSQTRNLLTPVLIHSVWNSGVIVLLTALRLQGYDINQFL